MRIWWANTLVPRPSRPLEARWVSEAVSCLPLHVHLFETIDTVNDMKNMISPDMIPHIHTRYIF